MNRHNLWGARARVHEEHARQGWRTFEGFERVFGAEEGGKDGVALGGAEGVHAALRAALAVGPAGLEKAFAMEVVKRLGLGCKRTRVHRVGAHTRTFA